eukprot:scaffold5143_cov139-Skeletonema_marinoi.AAC.11
MLMSSTSQSSATEAVAPTTLGPTALRTLVQNASIESQHCLDLNGIVWLEHLNLVVGDMDLALKFYVDFLGLSRDSNPKHVNLGQQQFHLAATDDPPQRITGSIGLTVPSLQKIKGRIERAKSDLQGTLFAIDKESDKVMTITCPWGNIFHLYDISLDDDHATESSTESPHKMVNMHAEGGAYGAHRMAVRGQPGIRYVEFTVPVETAQPIARFYEDVMKCNQVMTKTIDDSGNECAIIGVGPGVHFAFVESSELTTESLDMQEGVHACIYISNFESTYHELKGRGLIWTNPRFTHLDSCDTWEEACSSRTLRFKDVLDVKTGEKVLELEHETRPMRHGQYLKVPHYNPN